MAMVYNKKIHIFKAKKIYFQELSGEDFLSSVEKIKIGHKKEKRKIFGTVKFFFDFYQKIHSISS